MNCYTYSLHTSLPVGYFNLSPDQVHLQTSMPKSMLIIDRASQVTPLARHPTWFMRIVENHHSRSLIEQLVLETNPECRLNRLQRLRKIYTNPIVRLSAANRQRVRVIDAQIEELQFLMTDDNDKPLARYHINDEEDPSPPSTQLSESLEERPVPMIAQLADQQASESTDPGSGLRMIPYNRPMKRYLQESPRLPPRGATSSSHIRSGSIRLPSGTVSSQDWAESRKHPRASNNLSRVSEEASTSRVRPSKPSPSAVPASGVRTSRHNHSAPPPSVGPAVVLEPDPYNSSLLVPSTVRSSRKSTSRSKTSTDHQRHSRTTGRVSHKTASQYSEQIDVRPESRDPLMMPSGGMTVMR
jgi:hypothetical protein